MNSDKPPPVQETLQRVTCEVNGGRSIYTGAEVLDLLLDVRNAEQERAEVDDLEHQLELENK